jgi:hypothetical protein
MVRIERQRDFSTRGRSQGKEKQRGNQQMTHSNCSPRRLVSPDSQPIFFQ